VQSRVAPVPGATRLQNDLSCVEWNVKPYSLAHFTEFLGGTKKKLLELSDLYPEFFFLIYVK